MAGLHRVFVDSNVLYSRTLRDWLALLYLEGDLFQVFWSEDVLAEVIYHLRRDHPEWDGARLTTIHDKIAATFEVGRITDYAVDGRFTGSDRNDAHVDAAARAADADILLTANTGDFLEDPDGESYEVLAPDDFYCLVDDSAPSIVRRATTRQLLHWLRRSGESNLPQSLELAGCPEFAERIRRHQLTIDLSPVEAAAAEVQR